MLGTFGHSFLKIVFKRFQRVKPISVWYKVGTKYQRATCTKNMIISWTCGCPSFKNSRGKNDYVTWGMRIVKVTWNYDIKSMVSCSLSSICSNDLCLYPPVLSDCWWNLDVVVFFQIHILKCLFIVRIHYFLVFLWEVRPQQSVCLLYILYIP